MTRSKFISFSLVGALLATTGFMLPSYSHADTGYRSGTVHAVGYQDHHDYRNHRDYRDRRDYDHKRGHYKQHHDHHPPRHRHYVQRYYHAPHHYHRPYYAPRYYGHGGSGWDIDLHYHFSGH